jgi:hypothetical protein
MKLVPSDRDDVGEKLEEDAKSAAEKPVTQ